MSVRVHMLWTVGEQGSKCDGGYESKGPYVVEGRRTRVHVWWRVGEQGSMVVSRDNLGYRPGPGPAEEEWVAR